MSKKAKGCDRKAKMALELWTLYGVLLLSETCCSAINIEQCSPGPKYVYEHTPVQLTCGQCKDKIQWYVRGDNDRHEKYVGQCTKHTCIVEYKTAFRLHSNMINKLYSSVLDIINISPRDSLHVSCKCYYFYTQYLTSGFSLEGKASCKVITVPISIVPASFSVELSEWKVSGICTVQWQDGQTIPICTWSLKYKSKSRDLSHVHGPTTSVKQGSVWYKRRNCTFEVDMPVDDGDYTYSVTVPSHPADRFSKTIRIEQPEVPKHNCPEMVLEGSSINCTCYTSKIGNPPAHIAWSESNNEQLFSDNVGKEKTGTFDVCNLLWGNISKEAVYTIQVLLVSNCTTQSTVVHNVAPSGDLYTIAGTTIDDHGENENITLSDRFDKINYQAGAHPTRRMMQEKDDFKTTRTGAHYKNVTGVSANHGLGVYQNVTMATMSGYTESHKNKTTEDVLPIDEYNDLHFHVHSSGNDHNDTDYNDLLNDHFIDKLYHG